MMMTMSLMVVVRMRMMNANEEAVEEETQPNWFTDPTTIKTRKKNTNNLFGQQEEENFWYLAACATIASDLLVVHTDSAYDLWRFYNPRLYYVNDMIKMLVILRMNKDFMEYMSTHYAKEIIDHYGASFAPSPPPPPPPQARPPLSMRKRKMSYWLRSCKSWKCHLICHLFLEKKRRLP